MSLRLPPVPRTRRCARGAVSVMAALLIATVAIAALVSIDVGHVFMRQRQLQNMVDLAAMSAAQQLKRADSPASLNAAVLGTVSNIGAKNGYPSGIAMGCATAAGGGADAMTACLGEWDPVNISDPRHFGATTDEKKLNAVRVQATQTVPILFVIPGGKGRQLYAEAVASGSPPVAAFTLGSGLLDFTTDSRLLGFLLGNTVTLSALDWQGLVNTTVTLDQLRLKLGVGTVDELLNARLGLQGIYALVLGAANKDSLLSAALGSPPTTLGSSGASAAMTLGQLLNLDVLAPAASSAAQVGLSVASLLVTAAQVANGSSALGVNTSLIPVSIPGLSLTASARVVQPPVTAVGPVRKLGSSPDAWQTTANTSQVGVLLEATLSSPPAIAGIANLELKVPLYVEAAKATASLTDLQCAAAPKDRRATFNVSSGLVTACLWDTSRNACAGSTPVTIGSVRLLSGLLNDLLGALLGGLLGGSPADVTLTATDNPKQRSTPGTDVTLAPGAHQEVGGSSPVGGVLKNVLALNITANALGQNINLSSVLAPALTQLGALLDAALLQLLPPLGLQLGTADLWLHSIDCNNAELVY
ncbi:TadG family pilus assembly protein [Cupriavidus taiwanensis]|uniref:TadG family pilus assembly protein n=1 Tax=Cupriavidus taiwanensis TaxID=164546 RepID=UPI00253FAEA9|nr:TadG family pilus assembly protein [Cupriavidus taiwanensis]MDK3026531.1 TadG family pilus assembly protein [Cupriavidus taiwanensis]